MALGRKTLRQLSIAIANAERAPEGARSVCCMRR